MSNFQVGDIVVHQSHGPGEVIEVDEKTLNGRAESYYVVRMNDLTLWVPVDAQTPSTLRAPTPAHDFEHIFDILRGPGDPLPVDRLERKNYLSQHLRDGTLESICIVIRDLNTLRRQKKLSESDTAVFERAQKFLVSEWSLSLGVSPEEAQRSLEALLQS
jgi:RNA polymerase-interacting CarD/CdnL/TRCF family regulator